MADIKVTLVDHLGTDLSVVNSARVSMGKSKDELDASDEKLIKYLKKHKHESPFFHATAQFRVQVPIFVERQIFKSQIGFSYNSISLRYVEPPNEFYSFDTLRKSSPSIKQGSLPDSVDQEAQMQALYDYVCRKAFVIYKQLLLAGVCKEQARAVLPLSTMTEFIVTGSLAAWARMYNLRSKPDSQAETREYARQIGEIMLRLFPVSWKVLTETSEGDGE